MAGPGHPLLLHGTTVVHRAAPQVKIAATTAFIFAVVATPKEAFGVFALAAGLVLGVARLARVPWTTLGRRLVLEVPFLAFAFLLPFVSRGPRVDVAGVSLSESGLWGAWNILAKGTLGVAATLVLTATTGVPSLLRGLARLRLPSMIVQIMTFMVRYLEVVTEEMRRMRIARIARGHDPRWLWQTRAVASSAGALFIRSYERGERVHVAMLARGYDGTLPDTDPTRPPATHWYVALTPALLVAMAAVTAYVL